MGNNINYAVLFENELKQKYSRELLTNKLTTENINYFGANTIKIPFIGLSGYKFHKRDGGFNRSAVKNENMVKTLNHDRDIEFFVDTMDIDETNQVLAATNLTNVFESEHAIPELDAYRISKIFNEYAALGHNICDKIINSKNILEIYDDFMQEMDENEVPAEGRLLFVTPEINKMLSQTEGINRIMNAVSSKSRINRTIRMLDEVQIIVVPKSRMKTEYNFEDGFVALDTAKQINMLLIHPSSVIAANKHNYIKLWSPGTHTLGDGYLYQNRQYSDIFVLSTRAKGIAINAR